MVRGFLLLIAGCFGVFGAWALAAPLEMTSQLGMTVAGPNGAYEIRGVYGGVSFGAAALTGAGALLQRMRRPALWFLVAYMGGYCFSRIAALALGPPPEPYFWSFVAFEASSLLGALLCLRAISPPS